MLFEHSLQRDTLVKKEGSALAWEIKEVACF